MTSADEVFLFLGAENKLPVGIFNVCLQLIPPLNDSVSDDILAAQLDLEHTKSTERERLFLIYAKQWWKEYLEIREEHRTRLVKIFGQVIRRISFARIRSM